MVIGVSLSVVELHDSGNYRKMIDTSTLRTTISGSHTKNKFAPKQEPKLLSFMQICLLVFGVLTSDTPLLPGSIHAKMM